MKKMKLRRLAAVAALVVLPFAGDAQLLKGKADSLVKDLQIGISLEGDQGSTDYKGVELKPDGTFEFDATLITPFNDVVLYVNDTEIIGAHLEQGKTLELTLRAEPDGRLAYAFSGDNRTLSEFYTRFARAYDFMRYFPMDPSAKIDYRELNTLLTDEAKAVEALLPTIADADLRSYYARLAKASEKYLRLRLLTNEASEKEDATEENARYEALVNTIDVNDDISRRSGLAGEFIHSKIARELLAYGADMTPWALTYIDTVNRYVTDPQVKKSLARSCAYIYFTFGKGGEYEKFWEAFKEFAGEYPDLIAANEGKIVAMARTARGSDAFDAELQAPDGKTCRLSDHYGKVTYIDVWATWCGPCCAEIPYLEKLAARFKDDKRVQFISLSVDTDKKAWLAKLEKDQPEWAQFILSPEEAKQFMDAWGISGIPRFILIDKHGKIYAADAARPSDENIVTVIEEAMKEV